jgi:hypothetical protein
LRLVEIDQLSLHGVGPKFLTMTAAAIGGTLINVAFMTGNAYPSTIAVMFRNAADAQALEEFMAFRTFKRSGGVDEGSTVGILEECPGLGLSLGERANPRSRALSLSCHAGTGLRGFLGDGP